MSKTRLDRIRDAGLAVHREGDGELAEHFISAIAAMMHEATKPPKRAKPEKKNNRRRDAQILLDKLLVTCPRVVQYPKDGRWLNTMVSHLNNLEIKETDMLRVGRFVEAGHWWNNKAVTVPKLLKWLPDLMAASSEHALTGKVVMDGPQFA